MDGFSCLGIGVSIVVADNTRGAQTNAYPGVSGLEELDQGLRGRFMNISGRLQGNSSNDLANSEAFIRSFNDGLSHVVTDQYGFNWSNCKLENFEPQGRIEFAVDLNGNGPCYHRRYQLRFKILT